MGGRWCKQSAGAAVVVGPWNKSTQLFNICNHSLKILNAPDYLVPVACLVYDSLPPLLRKGLLALIGFELKEDGSFVGEVGHVCNPSGQADAFEKMTVGSASGVVEVEEQPPFFVGLQEFEQLDAGGLKGVFGGHRGYSLALV